MPKITVVLDTEADELLKIYMAHRRIQNKKSAINKFIKQFAPKAFKIVEEASRR